MDDGDDAEDEFDRRRRVLGDDHPHTLATATNLAADLRQLGEYEQARSLDRDTLTRRRRALGDDHPDILGTAASLADDLNHLPARDQTAQHDEPPVREIHRQSQDSD